MANWCNNTLEIQGDKLTLINIVRRLESSIEDKEDDRGVFEILVGQVPTGSTDDNHYGTTDIENVRDNFYMVGDIYGDILRFQFESRWSPPDKFVQKLSEKFKVKTELYYEEMGSDFCGKIWYTNGELVDSEEYSFLEGQYVFQEYEMFWGEVQYRLESYFVCEDDVEKDGINWFYENYSFVSDEDKEELLSMYKNEYGNYYGCEVEQTNWYDDGGVG